LNEVVERESFIGARLQLARRCCDASQPLTVGSQTAAPSALKLTHSTGSTQQAAQVTAALVLGDCSMGGTGFAGRF